MKIAFNPVIKNSKIHLNKSAKANVSQACKQTNLNGLDCLANYNLSFGANTRAVYAFDYDGNYERFDNIYDAQDKNGKKIYNVLNEICASADNKVYVYADTVEIENGVINSSGIYKALSGFRRARNQPIYSIDFDGNVHRFNDAKNVEDAKITAASSVSQILNQNRDAVNGYTFIKAFDVELRDKNGKLLRDENNNPILDDYAINKLREKFLYTKKGFPIVSIDKDGNVVIYRDMKEAITKTNIKRENMQQSMENGKITQERYTFARLADVVLIDEFGDVMYDENNDFMIDYDKIEEIRQAVFEKK